MAPTRNGDRGVHHDNQDRLERLTRAISERDSLAHLIVELLIDTPTADVSPLLRSYAAAKAAVEAIARE